LAAVGNGLSAGSGPGEKLLKELGDLLEEGEDCLKWLQKEPKSGADTGDRPCDEEEKDGPEDCEERIAGRHGYCFVL